MNPRGRGSSPGRKAGVSAATKPMGQAGDSRAVESPGRRAPSGGGTGWTSLILGLSLLLIYLANSRDLGTTDTVATTLLTLSLVRGDGLSLDRYLAAPLRDGENLYRQFVVRSHGRIISRYPVAPALLIAPLVAPQVALMDWARPGWDRQLPRMMIECKWMAK